MIAAFLIGRKQSKGFPGKNMYPVLGQPLAYYPLKAAKDCRQIDKIYLSTDDEQLMELADRNGVQVINRPLELCADHTLGEDIYTHAYNFAKNANKEEIDIAVLLMCNAPMITAKTISLGINILKEHLAYDSAVTVSRYNMWSPLRARRIEDDGLLYPFISLEAFGGHALSSHRDSQGDVWFADMGASIVRTKWLEDSEDGLLPQKWMGKKIYPLKQEGGLDVDYAWQIPMVENWLKANIKK